MALGLLTFNKAERELSPARTRPQKPRRALKAQKPRKPLKAQKPRKARKPLKAGAATKGTEGGGRARGRLRSRGEGQGTQPDLKHFHPVASNLV